MIRRAAIVALVVLPIAALVGCASHLAARIEYLILIAPATVGLTVGLACSYATRWQRLSRPRLAVAVAVAGIAVALVTHTALDYLHERRAWWELARLYGAGTDEATLSVTRFLERRFGLDPEMPPGKLASALGPLGTLGLTAVELALALWLAAAITRRQAAEPACPACDNWRLEHNLGVIAFGHSAELIARLTTGNAGAATELLAPPDTREQTRLVRMACPHGHDGGGGVLRVIDESRDRKGRPRRRISADIPLPDHAMARICDALGAREQ